MHFRCLHLTGGHLLIEKVARVVSVCVMLYNVALGQNIPIVPCQEGHNPCSVAAPVKEELRGAAEHQHGIMVLEDVCQNTSYRCVVKSGPLDGGLWWGLHCMRTWLLQASPA